MALPATTSVTPFSPFGWANAPSTISPVSAANLISVENRVTTYAELLEQQLRDDIIAENYGSGSGASEFATSGSKAAFLNVLEHGVLGDGNTGASQAATEAFTINAIITANHLARIIYFPARTYAVNSPILIPDNTYLVFAKGASLKACAGGTIGGSNALLWNTTASTPVGNSNICIEGGDFNGNDVTSNGVVRFIGSAGTPCKNIVFRNNTVHDGGTGGNAGQGLKFNNAEKCLIEGNKVYGNWQDGILFGGPTRDMVVANNICYDNGDDDIAVGGSTRCVVVGNICGDAGGGNGSGGNITARGGQHISIVGNTCFGCQGTAIYVSNEWKDAGIDLTDVIIGHNTVADTGLTGTEDGTGIKVAEWHGDVDAAASANTGPVKRIIIQGNTIRNTKGHAISFEPDSDVPGDAMTEILVKDNIISWGGGTTGQDETDNAAPTRVSSTAIGIYYDPSSHTVAGRVHTSGNLVDISVTGNRIVNAQGVQVDFSSAKVKRIQFHDNVLRRANGKTVVGATFDGAANVSIQNNIVYDSRGAGLTQTIGIKATDCVGTSLVIIGNDSNNWVNAAATAAARITYTTTNVTQAKIMGNPGVANAFKGID